MDIRDEIMNVMPVSLRSCYGWSCIDFDNTSQIRLRSGRPVIIESKGKEYFLRQDNTLNDNYYILSQRELSQMGEYITNYSVYAYENEIRQGYVTLFGGHRIGVCGSLAVENGKIISVQYISSLNIRIAHQIKGCAEKIIDCLFENRRTFYNTLIISPPGCGKTTLLRDIVRLVSDGDAKRAGKNVAIVDERAEIAAMFHGTATNDIGMRTDVIENCDKKTAMEILLRTMSPQVIAVDELGNSEDMKKLCDIAQRGVNVVATRHAAGIEEADEKLKEVFKRIIVLQKDSAVTAKIYDEHGGICWEGEI